MEQIRKDKIYWKDAIRIALPSVAESAFVMLAGIIDTLMVSSLGEYAVASVGLTNQPKFLGWTVFIALGVAISALVARRRGEEDKVSANETLITALSLVLLFTFIVSIITVALADPIMRFAGSSEDTHEYAVAYYRIIMGGMIFNMISIAINAAQRGSGNTHIAFQTNLVSSIVNVCFNYLLIGGKFGFPAWGIRGAAIATVIGTVIGSIMSIRSLFRSDSYVEIFYILEKKILPTLNTAISLLKLAATIAVENIAMRVGFMTTAIIAARLGTGQFAAHNVGMNILGIGFAFADGMQVAAIALTGQSLGRGEKDMAKKYGKICQRIGLIISITLSIFLLLFGEWIFSLFFEDPKTIAYGDIINKFIMIIVLLQISQIIYGGILRAAGDVRYTLMASIIAITIIRTMTTIILTQVFNMGLIGIWLGILSDQLTRFILLRHRFKKGKWVGIKI